MSHLSLTHRDIELVSLDRLIETYADALEQGKAEPYWQAFFDDNAFALQQVFGAPMVSVRSGANVGGRGLSGSGDKIADYLFKNSLTNNVALVEIKKPATQLLEARGTWSPTQSPASWLLGEHPPLAIRQDKNRSSCTARTRAA